MSKFSPVSYKTLCRVLEAEGFRLIRQEGDHLTYTRAGVLRPVVVPKYSSVPVFIVKNNLRTAGISRERYFELMREYPKPRRATDN